MHFREKGGRIQFVRTTYDPGTKRSKYTVVGGMSRVTLDVKPEVLSNLTDDENRELYTFIEAQRSGALLEGRLHANRLPHIVASILDYAQTAEPEEKDLILNHMLRASLEFQSFVRKERG